MVFREGNNTVAHIILRNTRSPRLYSLVSGGRWSGSLPSGNTLARKGSVTPAGFKAREACEGEKPHAMVQLESDARLGLRLSPAGVYLSGAESGILLFGKR